MSLPCGTWVISMKLPYLLTLKSICQSCILNGSFSMYDSLTSRTHHLENTSSLNYADLQNFSSFHYTPICIKLPFVNIPPASSEKSLNIRKPPSSWWKIRVSNFCSKVQTFITGNACCHFSWNDRLTWFILRKYPSK